ncbi:hypothetical protein ACKKBF_B39605 [Auxenochlorella protothecoides x Auxenochlorella symbiontica]
MRRTTPRLLLSILCILEVVRTVASCDTTFFGLPSARSGSALFLLTPGSSNLFCKKEGFHGAGSIRTATIEFTRLHTPAVNLATLGTCSAPSCQALVAVECLRKGQTACKADGQGNIGPGNIGWHNFGSGNIGDKNIGVKNFGNRNIGSQNQGNHNICNGLQGNTPQCKLSALNTPNTIVLSRPSSPKPKPSPPPPPKHSPPPPKKKSPPPPTIPVLVVDSAVCTALTKSTASCTVKVTSDKDSRGHLDGAHRLCHWHSPGLIHRSVHREDYDVAGQGHQAGGSSPSLAKEGVPSPCFPPAPPSLSPSPFPLPPSPFPTSPFPTSAVPLSPSPFPFSPAPFPTAAVLLSPSPSPFSPAPFPTAAVPLSPSPFPTAAAPFSPAPFPTASAPFSPTPFPTAAASFSPTPSPAPFSPAVALGGELRNSLAAVPSAEVLDVAAGHIQSVARRSCCLPPATQRREGIPFYTQDFCPSYV